MPYKHFVSGSQARPGGAQQHRVDFPDPQTGGRVCQPGRGYFTRMIEGAAEIGDKATGVASGGRLAGHPGVSDPSHNAGGANMALRPLGDTGLSVTSICVGTSALGGRAPQYPYDVDAATAVATIRSAFDGPFNFLDTSNEYGGGGGSERRIGRAITEAGGLPPGFVLATKVDPSPGSHDFSGDRIRASIRESLERLGVDHLQLVYLHDPQRMSFEKAIAPDGPVEALVRLRDEGTIGHLGVAGGEPDLALRYLNTDHFSVVLNHNQFTLLDQSAERLMDEANVRGAAFVNAAPFGGGMLAKGPTAVAAYRYRPASASVVERARRMHSLCESYGVPLAAAALQFSQRDPRICSTVVGMSEPARVEQTVQLATVPVPDELWDRLNPLISERRHGLH